MQNDLLWVCEELTQYYGDVSPREPASERQRRPSASSTSRHFESISPDIDGDPSRRPPPRPPFCATTWAGSRLSQGNDDAGTLLWLEADVKMRQLTHGARSLDDVAALSFAPLLPGSAARNTGPDVPPYTFPDLRQALNTTVPYDW